MFTKFLSGVLLVVPLVHITALPQSTKELSIRSEEFTVGFTAYPANAADASTCPDGGKVPNPNGYQTGALTGMDSSTACVKLNGDAGNYFWWSTSWFHLQVGLFASDDCNGNYKPFMATNVDGGTALTTGTGCVAANQLPGDPSVGSYKSMKILAYCPSPDNCLY